MTNLVAEFGALGVARGGVLLVHTSLSKIGPVDEGPQGVIRALLDAIGPDGTLVMPSMSDEDDEPFDAGGTPCLGMGIVADTFWRMPRVARSNSPHAFAALGPHAARITADHPFDVPHGPDSPVGRVHDLDGQVLLLGVGHDADTTVHLAESLAGVRYRRRKVLTLLVAGRAERHEYAEIDHCCERFQLVDAWLDAEGRQQRGLVGHGEGRLARARDIVASVVARLRADETVFLHEPGVDAECDDARSSLAWAGSLHAGERSPYS